MDEDTIEMELTGEEQLQLSQAAKGEQAMARPIGSTSDSLSPTFESLVYRRTARIDFICGLMFALAGVGITAATVWHAANRNPPAPALTSTAPAAPPLAAPAQPPAPLMQVRNPFDATEVFEFPAETTKTEAREAMAELLLQRARDRSSLGIGIKHAGSRRPSRGAADEQPDVLVSESSGHPSRANQF
jgi:hypothetical protein